MRLYLYGSLVSAGKHHHGFYVVCSKLHSFPDSDYSLVMATFLVIKETEALFSNLPLCHEPRIVPESVTLCFFYFLSIL